MSPEFGNSCHNLNFIFLMSPFGVKFPFFKLFLFLYLLKMLQQTVNEIVQGKNKLG